MDILAHRGLGFSLPENSRESFETALKQGFGLEIDVRFSKNGEVVISHDPASSTAPPLNELTPLLKNTKNAVAIHLKEASYELIEQTFHHLGSPSHIFYFDPMIDHAEKAKSNLPGIQIAYSVGEDRFSPSIYLIDDIISRPDCDVIWWDEWGKAGSIYNQQQMKIIRKHKKKVYAISPELHSTGDVTHDHASSPETTWQSLIQLGVDGICTDFPRRLSQFKKRAEVGS